MHGDVLLDDRKNGHQQMAREGMTLDATGHYLIATTATSRAVIAANGKVIKLEPSTYLHIRGDRSSWERHQETWTGHAKRFLGGSGPASIEARGTRTRACKGAAACAADRYSFSFTSMSTSTSLGVLRKTTRSSVR